MRCVRLCIGLAAFLPLAFSRVIDITSGKALGSSDLKSPFQQRELSTEVSTAAAGWSAPRADDTEWIKARCKGATLIAMMTRNDEEAGGLLEGSPDSAASAFTDFPHEFEKWGYTHEDQTGEFECDLDMIGVTSALKGLGVSEKNRDEGGQVVCWGIQHAQDKIIDNKEYKATGANYFLGLNPVDSVIIGMSLYSPAHMGKAKIPPVTVLPDLQQTSDVIWGQWILQAKERANNIRYYIVNAITNSATGPIIQSALESADAAPLKKWPGHSFGMDTDEGKALLGTPVGVGIAYLLAQHKAQLGIKTVSKVDVFEPDEGGNPSLAFHIG